MNNSNINWKQIIAYHSNRETRFQINHYRLVVYLYDNVDTISYHDYQMYAQRYCLSYMSIEAFKECGFGQIELHNPLPVLLELINDEEILIKENYPLHAD